MKYTCILLCLFFVGISNAQTKNTNSEEISVTKFVNGTLLIPEPLATTTLAIIITDSGPVTRDGNQQMAENNCLRYLAQGLFNKGIATYRYDKRLVTLMKRGAIQEKNIHFDDFIEDANAVLAFFKKDKRFSKIYVIGHGQGSLIGMIAGQNNMDGFISIAGAGQELDDVIVSQLEVQSPGLTESARLAFDDLRANGVAYNYSQGLASIFRKELQPFLYTWMKYNPKTEIAKLKVPVLIINGDKDFQVQVSEAEHLKAAKPDAEYKIIKNMNHIFKEIDGDDLENSKSYNEYKRPIMPELIEAVSGFIKK